MIITVKVNASAKKESIELKDGIYHVKFFAIREKGKANAKLTQILAEYFHVRKSSIQILRGKTSTIKQIKIIT